MAKGKRIVALADMHCGHVAGLTPPKWQYRRESDDAYLKHFGEMQHAEWQWYKNVCKELQPVDALIVNGDAIDGKGEKSGGTEQITTDRREQTVIAADCIREMKAKEVYLIFGTPYHGGNEEDWEAVLAQEVGAQKVGSHEWFDAEGLIFDCKHFVSGSIIPHGRHTSISRDKLWNEMWAAKGGQPLADVLIRAHVHYFNFCGEPGKLMVILPSLQLWSKFGARKQSGIINTGLVHFDVVSKDDYSWRPHLVEMRAFAPKPIKL